MVGEIKSETKKKRKQKRERMECPVCPVCYDDREHPVMWLRNDADAEEYISYCWECTMNMKENHYGRWFKSIQDADCAAALRRLIGIGPPMTIADAIEGLTPSTPPCFGTIKCGNQSVSGKLKGSKETEEKRNAFWDKLKERLQIFEAIELEETK